MNFHRSIHEDAANFASVPSVPSVSVDVPELSSAVCDVYHMTKEVR